MKQSFWISSPAPRFSPRLRTVFRTGTLVAAALLGLPAPLARAADPPLIEKRVKDLEETVRQLQAEIQRLKAERSAATSAPGATKPSSEAAAVAKAGPGGFGIQSADGHFSIRLRGLLQSDFRTFASGPTGVDNLSLRRLRPALEGTVYRDFNYRLQMEFGEGRTSLQDAYLEYAGNPSAVLRAGKLKTPFSIERLQNAPDTTFIERSIANSLSPIRDVGIQVGGELLRGRLGYAVGGFDGAADSGSADLDTDNNKDVAIRIFGRPLGGSLSGLTLGLGSTMGGRSLAPLGAYRTAGRSPFFSYLSGVTADGYASRLAPQLSFYHGPFGLMAEYLQSTSHLLGTAGAATATHRAWMVQGSWLLTGEAAGLRRPSPRRVFNPRTGSWGALEAAFRWSEFQADDVVFRQGLADPALATERARAWTFGLNWYLNSAVRLQFNYERTTFGRPLRFGTTLSNHENVFLTRVQLAF